MNEDRLCVKNINILKSKTRGEKIMILPSIREKTILRPGDLSGGFSKCLIPKKDTDFFWGEVYKQLKEVLSSPLSKNIYSIDPDFGYFGYRFHPVNLKPNYFHIGIDIMGEKGESVFSTYEGIFEYSGFSNLNGNYVLLGHPEIKTQDGFVLYSVYMHLDRFFYSFRLFEKILRVMGMRKITDRKIEKFVVLGEVGATGNIKGFVPHLHFQLEFRSEDGVIIAIDPARALGLDVKKNLTKSISSVEDFKKYYQENKARLSKWAPLWNFEKGGNQ